MVRTAMSANQVILLASLLLVCSVARATDDELPDADFLEYLGIWDESDEEWMIFNDPEKQDRNKRSDPAPEGKESAEKDDES